MGYRRFFLFVEGEDDRRFFEKVLLPLLRERYDHIDPVLHRRLTDDKLISFLRSAAQMAADYLFVRDLDRFPCVSAAKEAMARRFRPLDPARIQGVRPEIESWYCAGLREQEGRLGALDIATCAATDGVTKEVFDSAIEKLGQPRIPIMLEMLEGFDLQRAARRNTSFRYFLRKHLGREI